MREGIIKHSRDYDPARFPELAEYCLDQSPPLEAQLIDLTDEIAYNSADLDDGYESRILDLAGIRRHVGVFERFYREAEAKYTGVSEKLKFNEALKGMLNRLVTDLIENTRRRVEAGGVRDLEDVRRQPDRLAAFSDEAERERAQAKQFLYEHLYYSARLQPEKQRAEDVVSGLFRHWTECPQDLPAAYQQQAQSEPLPRVICDYIAGMTDNYILDQHRKFCSGRRRAAAPRPTS